MLRKFVIKDGKKYIVNIPTWSDAPSPSLTNVGSSGGAKIDPYLIWGKPANILHGTKISSKQLCALAIHNDKEIDGTYTYNVNIDDILPVGTHILQVLFIPTDNTKYAKTRWYAELTVVADPNTNKEENNNAEDDNDE